MSDNQKSATYERALIAAARIYDWECGVSAPTERELEEAFCDCCKARDELSLLNSSDLAVNIYELLNEAVLTCCVLGHTRRELAARKPEVAL